MTAKTKEKETNNTVQITEQSASQRFTDMVIKEYSALPGKHEFTQQEQRLIRGYFIKIDEMLKSTEDERQRKNANNKDPKYNNELAYNWNTINLPQLAQDLVHYARVGLDMMEDNHLFPIPFKDNKNNRYDINLMEGYNGIKYQAEKYALIPFVNVTTEVVYSTDKFKAYKKGKDQDFDTYVFEITQPFDRGYPVGAFGYIEYADKTKNQLITMSGKDIEKRKPRYASAEFWGGTKKVWENGKQVETELDGWLPEMYLKTIKRETYGSKNIPRDPNKIDESYMYIKQREAEFAIARAEHEALENANKEDLMLPEVVVDGAVVETVEEEKPPVEEAKPEPKKASKTEQVPMMADLAEVPF